MRTIRIKTSFVSFALATNKSQPKAKQNIHTRSLYLIRDGKQKCLACQGIATIAKGKISSFYPIGEQYPHRENCNNQ